MAAVLAALLVAAPALAGPRGAAVNKRSTGAAVKGCAALEARPGKRKGVKPRGARRAECGARLTPADAPEDQGSTERDDAVGSAPVLAADQGAADAGEIAGSGLPASADQASAEATSPFAVVPSCQGLDWAGCDDKLREAGFTNYQRAIDPYDNCGCGPGGTWRIIDDFGERMEGWTIDKDAHLIVETNPDA